ncbi:MAG: hypothetical protein JSS02_21820 [Planctomycetes bacterium]|nr:hypothetical protein [Planctomycetota bacterium]
MEIVLSVAGAAFGAFCIWLTVRIINRRELWAKKAVSTLIVVGSGISTFVVFAKILMIHGDNTGPLAISLFAAVIAAIASLVFCIWLFGQFLS